MQLSDISYQIKSKMWAFIEIALRPAEEARWHILNYCSWIYLPRFFNI